MKYGTDCKKAKSRIFFATICVARIFKPLNSKKNSLKKIPIKSKPQLVNSIV